MSGKAIEYSEALKLFTHRIGEIVKKNVGIDSSLTMPANQADIFKQLVFMTNDSSGKQIDLSFRGDGIKAMHIPAILKYIAEQDNKLLANSAVPYTPIWGYEEPENGIEMKKNSVYCEIEHLLSYKFWEKMKIWNWTEHKEKGELIEVYNKVLTIDKSLDAVIDKIVDDTDMKDTILYWNPKEDKKAQIVKSVIREVEEGDISIIEGFKNTIIELEKEMT